MWQNGPWGTLWLCPTRCHLDKDKRHRWDHLGFCQLVVLLPDLPLQVNRYTARRACARCPMIFFRADFVVLTIDSEHPLWCGARGVVNCHFIPLSAENLCAWLCPNLLSLGIVLTLLPPFQNHCWKSSTLGNHGTKRIFLKPVKTPWYLHR